MRLGDDDAIIPCIETPFSKLQGIFDPQGSTLSSDRSLTQKQAIRNALAPGYRFPHEPPFQNASGVIPNLKR